MFYRTALSAVMVALFSVGASSTAQTEPVQIESESLGDLSAWGQRFLSKEEVEFPTTLWNGSDSDTLLALMQSIEIDTLNPAARKLLRRTILSPAARPRGARAEDLLAERARLMLELGESRAAAALAPQLDQTILGMDAEALAVDLDMASGQELSGCAALDGPLKLDAYWLKLRAVCAALQDNFSGAQIAIEFAEAQGIDDEWLVEAIFAASGDSPKPPSARFDSGLNIALSAKANLDTSTVTLSADRTDLTAAAAQRPGIPLELRARFAERASEIDLMTVAERRDILLTQIDDPDHDVRSDLERALQELHDPLLSDDVRSATLASVLRAASRSDLARYRNTARLFVPDLQTLPKNSLTADFAVEFARAAMIAGDRRLAQSWIASLDIEGAEQPDPYDVAILEAVDVIAGGDDSNASLRAIEKRLINTANSGPREYQVVSIFTAWVGLGIPLSPVAREYVAQTSDRGNRIAQGQLISLKSASRNGAIGESALMIVALMHGDAGLLASADLVFLLEILQSIDAGDVARDLALETSGFWKEIDE